MVRSSAALSELLVTRSTPVEHTPDAGTEAQRGEELGSEFYSGPNTGSATGCPDLSLHSRLMSIDPWECAAGAKYVVAGSPTNSYVMQKINGAPLCSEGGAPSVQMPPSDSQFTLSPTDKNLIQQWIAEGALDN